MHDKLFNFIIPFMFILFILTPLLLMSCATSILVPIGVVAVVVLVIVAESIPTDYDDY